MFDKEYHANQQVSAGLVESSFANMILLRKREREREIAGITVWMNFNSLTAARRIGCL